MGTYSELVKTSQPSTEKKRDKRAIQKPGQRVVKQTRKQADKKASMHASHMTILQFTDEEVADLKRPAYQAQTFRLTREDIEWFKDTTYRLSKELERGKVAQADILRISIKVFQNLLAAHKSALVELLRRIK